MVDVGAGAIQTLIATLQNSNTQSGHIIKAIENLGPPISQFGTHVASASARMEAAMERTARVNGQLHGTVSASAPLPEQPDGYITVEIPGVGPRRIPYYV